MLFGRTWVKVKTQSAGKKNFLQKIFVSLHSSYYVYVCSSILFKRPTLHHQAPKAATASRSEGKNLTGFTGSNSERGVFFIS